MKKHYLSGINKKQPNNPVAHSISVIIPLYNTEAYIARCVESVLSQRFDAIEEQVRLECVVVNDGSDDSGADIVRQIAVTDPRLKLIVHEKNQGQSAARNTAFDHSSGEWVYYLDSDDQLPDNALQTMLLAIINIQSQQSVDFVQGCYLRLYPTGESKLSQTMPGRFSTHEQIIKGVSDQIINLNNVTNKLIRRSIAAHRFEQGLIFEDAIWMVGIYPRLAHVVVINEPTYVQNVREGSIMQSRFTTLKAESVVRLVELILATSPNDQPMRQMAVATSLNMIKNIYLTTDGEFDSRSRRRIIERLKATGVNKADFDKSKLLPFARLLSRGFRSMCRPWFWISCRLYGFSKKTINTTK